MNPVDSDKPSTPNGKQANLDDAMPMLSQDGPSDPSQPIEDPEGHSKSARKQIGPYKILQKIAEGGMGAVYMAEQQEPIRRRVALKLIKAGKDSEQIITRFEAERQALAMMEHENIAKILDAGTTDGGSPYFVMELVKGIPLTEYCDKHRLSIKERLNLFVPVCKAVQHAHQKGIIHRDLKPSNVLVALYDGVPVPKVIDFGLAKATGHQTRLTDKTMFTEFGQVIGTLQYMSPEQAEVNQLDVDTRTDVYSLGVILYELLTGSTPLEKATMQQQALLGVLEMIREKEPQRPSTRLSDSGDAITGVSAQRKIDPSKLQRILRGELDWVVMKSLEKDRTRRYETATAFADDISRFLNDEAVIARPQSASYKLKTFVRKNKGLVAAIASIAILLVAGIAGTSVQMIRANRNAKLANVNEANATQSKVEAQKQEAIAKEKTELAVREANDQAALTEFMLDVFGAGDPLFGGFASQFGVGLGQSTTVVDLVDKATKQLESNEKNLSDKPLINARMLDRLADVQMTLGNLKKSREMHTRATLQLQAAGIDDGIDFAKNLMALGILDYLFGDMNECRERLEQSLGIRTRELNKLPNTRAELRDLQLTRIYLAILWSEYEQFDKAEHYFQLVSDSDRTAAPESPLQIAMAKLMLAATKTYRLDVNGQSKLLAIPQMTQALTEISKPEFNDSLGAPIRLAVQMEINRLLNLENNVTQGYQNFAEQMKSRLGENHFLNTLPKFALANNARQQEDYANAALYFNEMIAMADQQLGRRHTRFAMILQQYGTMLVHQWRDSDDKSTSKLPRAVELLEESLAIRLRILGDSHRLVSVSRYWLARAEAAVDNHDPAFLNYLETLRIRRRLYPESDKRVNTCRRRMNESLKEIKQLDQARAAVQAVSGRLKNSASSKKDEQVVATFELLLGRINMDQANVPSEREEVTKLIQTSLKSLANGQKEYDVLIKEYTTLLQQQ